MEQVKSFKSEHQGGREADTTTPFTPQETQDPQKVLQLHNREHPDQLHHHLVWQLLGI